MTSGDNARLQTQDWERDRVSLITKSIATYSPSGQEKGMATLLFEELVCAGLSPRIDGAGNAICEVGSGRRSILLCGHMDTVPGELPVVHEGDVIRGRGACDAKGPLMSLLFAFEDLAKRRDLISIGRVIFAGVTEEERTSAGLRELIKQGIRADYAIFGEPCGLSKITIGYRGHLPTLIRVETESSHGSAPSLSTNSAEVAFEVYLKLRDRTWPKRSKEDRGNSVEDVSVSLTEIHGGSAHNVTPASTEITLDIRLPFGVSVESAKEAVESSLEEVRRKQKGARIIAQFDDPTEAYRARLDSDLVRSLSRALLRSPSKVRPSYIEKSGTGDMNTYASTFGIQAVTYGPGDTKLSHTSEERVSVGEILECSKILVETVEELFRIA